MLVRTPVDIGLAIRSRRRELNLDQEALAKLVKVSRQWIVEVERGKARAEIGLILRTIYSLGLALSIDTETRATATVSPTATVPTVDIDEILDDLSPSRS